MSCGYVLSFTFFKILPDRKFHLFQKICHRTQFNDLVLTDNNVIPTYKVRTSSMLVLVVVGIQRAKCTFCGKSSLNFNGI